MDILTIKEASLMWGISVRRITVLCNEGRIPSKENSRCLLLPKDTGRNPPMRELSQENIWIEKQNKYDLGDFESNLKF